MSLFDLLQGRQEEKERRREASNGRNKMAIAHEQSFSSCLCIRRTNLQKNILKCFSSCLCIYGAQMIPCFHRGTSLLFNALLLYCTRCNM
ncbi:hypothetical protein POPTR_005G026425v4 [Populus trichocarpa]|uniref:Uncharacterized protein n=1 Tax=Populus trichocarpa TaxID=3694 RepID=A0ACC0SXC7_POPTR|nr:hypothetical protein POPTR_005G026425v4 [Populus trichocarpa]